MLTEEKVNQIKKDCLQMCMGAGAGHISSAYSCAEIVSVLYYEIMRIDPQNPSWEKRDRFVMSKNHGSIITYPILADLGFFDKSKLDSFLKDGSPFGMHTKKNIPGVDFLGGSLGIGIGMACGMAYAAKLSGEDWMTFCLVGDGECYEGSVWEAAIFAGAHNLKNLIVIIDRNRMCITDFTERMLPLDSMGKKWEAFGWEVKEINGHDMEQIRKELVNVRLRQDKPLCVIANTVKGKGIDFIENEPLWHGRTPVGEEGKRALAQAEEW